MSTTGKRIISSITAESMIGRTLELKVLSEYANGSGYRPLTLLSPPAAGATELLKRLYDDLFPAGNVIPFYIEIKADTATAQAAAGQFFREFARQLAAFRSRRPEILKYTPTHKEAAELLTPFDAKLLSPLFEIADNAGTEDQQVLSLLSAPMRISAKGERIVVILDGLHNADMSEEGEEFRQQIIDVFSNAEFPVIFSGRRRSLFGKISSARLNLKHLSFEQTGELIEHLAAENDVAITDASRDLISRQCSGRPGFIRSLIMNAAAKKMHLRTFKAAQLIYAEELVDGGIGRFYEREIRRAAGNAAAFKELLKLLADAALPENGPVPVESLRKIPGFDDAASAECVRALNIAEIIKENGGLEPADDDIALNDLLYIKRTVARRKANAAYSTRSLAFGEAVLSLINKAPERMAEHYRNSSAIGLREIMESFDGRKIPAALMDHGIFAEHYKGLPQNDITNGILNSEAGMQLPDIAYSVNAGSIYKPLAEILERPRAAAAFGFADACGGARTVWLAAEIDTKLEATLETAEFWCDRLETAAIMAGIENFRIWLVAPEGFDKDAREYLAGRGFIGSNRSQVKLLGEFLKDNRFADAERPDHEAVFSMGDEPEIAAANTVEEIAKKHNFPAKAINQMKNAVVEAFINAAEHSHSPDRKIHLAVKFDRDRLVITVANRGVRLLDRMPASDAEEKRRGWGLKLIRKLMDEVEISPVDDGTKIKMTKYLAS